ncbi:CHAT domain-containing protein [Agriterribacter sp.]|uniref:CHAT domain-containing protein n=1 Tax=Agriterribacter sp. TaxID=2821509 RepID=UPI002C8CD6B4|nr:CHAT domain-containing protein [Agriterribacter sp.]HRP55932.1 CHAT domain-containing protein [Agriterribacter sp.]
MPTRFILHTGTLLTVKHCFCCAAALWLCLTGYSQQHLIAERIFSIEHNPAFPAEQKLSHLYRVKAQYDSSGLVKDTIYAKMLGSIGLYEFIVSNNYDAAIQHTLSAAAIAVTAEPTPAFFMATGHYFNLGFYYDKTQRFSKALAYYDTAIIISRKVAGRESRMLDARLGKIYIYFRTGDYQKSVEESTGGIITALQLGDSLRYLDFLNQRGQSLFFQNQLEQSLSDIETVIPVAKRLHQPHRLASAYKMKGFIYAKRRNFRVAAAAFENAIEARKQTADIGQIAGDYNDLGNFCFDSLKNPQHARMYYGQGIKYAGQAKDSVRLSRLSLNIGRTYIDEDEFKKAEAYLFRAFLYLGINTGSGLRNSSVVAAIARSQNKELLLYILENKTWLLQRLYEAQKDKHFLHDCLAVALLTDSVVTQLRHEQTGEQSKLYWRDRTRPFFATALKACYAAEDPALAFYFMEKSRAVLLSDKLSELGAMAHLPAEEHNAEQEYKRRIASEEQKLNALPAHAAQYKQQQLIVLHAKNGFEHYIRTLEQKYPAYYQYKYSSKVPSLAELQEYLLKRNARFVHYFVEDTTVYILHIMPDATKMIQLHSDDFYSDQIRDFIGYCSNKQRLNNNFRGFASLSHALYKNLFEPLQLPAGRVILCQDNFLLPFEALCKDEKGKQFLVYDHVFSYVYSAGYLLKEMNAPVAKGNYIGFAPVSFAPDLALPALTNSATFLEHTASYYNAATLYTGANASRRNFMEAVPGYSIANIFSHALADTGNAEPLLYMQDSVIHLSELQLLNRPATQLIMLSACQTNAGRNATGEGIYSLARGFSSAGIPSVAATLWKADEQAIYALSDKFNEYLSEGMCKDDALQKAKLYFIEQGGREKLLPYFWANMVLMGNTEPVTFPDSGSVPWWLMPAITLLLAPVLYIVMKRKRKGLKTDFRKLQ